MNVNAINFRPTNLDRNLFILSTIVFIALTVLAGIDAARGHEMPDWLHAIGTIGTGESGLLFACVLVPLVPGYIFGSHYLSRKFSRPSFNKIVQAYIPEKKCNVVSTDAENLCSFSTSIFPLTNEKDPDNTVTTLAQSVNSSTNSGGKRGNLIISFGGMSILDLFARCNDATHLLAIDISYEYHEFWRNVGEIIKESKNKEQAIEKLRNLFRLSYSNYLVKFKEEIQSGNSFLCNDNWYNKVRELFLRENFAFACVDFASPNQILQVREAIENAGLTPLIFNISNVGDYVKRELFQRSLNRLVEPNTWLMYSSHLRESRERSLIKQCAQISRVRSVETITNFYFDNEGDPISLQSNTNLFAQARSYISLF